MTFFFARQAPRRAGAHAICALCAVITASGAVAEDARGAQRATIVEDIAPPTREGFKDIVVQLPPLVPVRRKAQAPTQAVPSAPTPETVAAAPSTPLSPMQALSDAPKAAQTPSVAQETLEIEPPRAEAQLAPTVSATRDVVAPEAPTALAAPGAPVAAPAQQAVAEQPVVETIERPQPRGETPADVAAPADLRGSEQPKESASNVPPEAASEPPAENAPSEATPLLETAKPAPQQEETVSESEGEGALFETWQLIVAGLALGGLLVLRLRRKKGEPTPKQAVARSPRIEKLRHLVKSARSKIAPFVEAGVRRAVIAWREKSAVLLRKRAPDEQSGKAAPPGAEASAKAQRSAIVNWPEIATTLRAKLAPAKSASPAPAPNKPAATANVGEAAKASATGALPERDGWDQPDHDAIELLEPGAASTRAIIMNARRKLRAAQG